MMTDNNTSSPHERREATGEAPRLKANKIGVVSRDFRHLYKNRFRDFSEVLPEVLKILDQKGCDTVLFALFTIIPRPSFKPLSHMRNLRHIKSVLYEEFSGWRFIKGKWDGRKGSGRYVVFHRKGSKWSAYPLFQKKFASLNPLTSEKRKEVSALCEEIPNKRVLGNCCILLCGESHGVIYHPRDREVRDDFHLRRAIPKNADIILNPIHDRMTRFVSKKRAFLSENGRWVISVWNKGKIDKRGKVRDGSRPAWAVFHNGKNDEGRIKLIPNQLGLEIGIVDVPKG